MKAHSKGVARSRLFPLSVDCEMINNIVILAR